MRWGRKRNIVETENLGAVRQGAPDLLDEKQETYVVIMVTTRWRW